MIIWQEYGKEYDYNLRLGVMQKLLTVAIRSHYYQHCKIVQHICTSSAEHLVLKLCGRIKGTTSAILSKNIPMKVFGVLLYSVKFWQGKNFGDAIDQYFTHPIQ